MARARKADERPAAVPVDRGIAAREGLPWLGPDGVALRTALEERFVGWAAERGAEQALYPPLIRVDALDRLDYFRNFPHLGVLATGIAPEAIADSYASGAAVTSVPVRDLLPVQYVLPSAACFNVYLSMAGEILDGPRLVTTVANCFRREEHFDDHRLLGFTMREIVCVGDRDAVLAHLAHFKERILAFASAIGLPLSAKPSSDPFFDASGARAVMQQLFPVKEELVHGDDDHEVALASLNYHRNFFGERCEIELPDGTPAFSSCVAFGLERWIAVLLSSVDGGHEEIRRRMSGAA
jgi:hypothetical protein